jgi:NAD(P)-dependent dehydrogenase (short-subunit alcohol dehydrogenase family)
LHRSDPTFVASSATIADPQDHLQRMIGLPFRCVGQDADGSRQGRRKFWMVGGQTHFHDIGRKLAMRLADAGQSVLVFCPSRTTAERMLARLRKSDGTYDDHVAVYRSGLSNHQRAEIEQGLRDGTKRLVFSTTALELGIDIGSVDDVVLLGAPPTLTSFLQRIGRGSRRAAATRVLCLPKSSAEWARFDGLLALAANPPPPDDVAACIFRPSVLVQQIFSLCQQSPTGGVRLADVRRLAPAEVSSEAVRAIVGELVVRHYLRPGRPGEWKPGPLLQELIDRYEIHSNIGSDLLRCEAVDAYTNRVIATTERRPPVGRIVLFGGQARRVVWHARNQFGLAPAAEVPDELLRIHSVGAVVPFDVAQAVARLLGAARGEWPTLPTDDGVWLFHFCGTVWGELLAALLGTHVAQPINEFCLYVTGPLDVLPVWDATSAESAACALAPSLGERMQPGRFHGLLPPAVAARAAQAQLDWIGFGRHYQTARLVPGERWAAQLHALRR